ncbi:MAG: phenylalanine--tRNA ligase subunit beta, partial [Chitinophagaceae bacterium]
MKISYNWLCELLPVKPKPEELSVILTSIGLEVESLEKYEEVKGNLEGLLIGEVLEVKPHPNADKLKITKVNTGGNEPLNIVCGASNVAEGQKVVVATIGTTIYPTGKAPLTMKAARIRGEESQGMICAEDEIGLGGSHAGIMVLNHGAEPGMTAKEYFQPAEDWIYEIGLTPNRMDAMSHLGVARDVCAWLSNHNGKVVKPVIQPVDNFKVDDQSLKFIVQVENVKDCPRYSGISLNNVKVAESPVWLKRKLKAIGIRPINNVVDITNYILNECGQPLHAFDGDRIAGKKVIVKNLPQGSPFVTLDAKERKLDAKDLMICDEKGGMCIAGVFGGLHSGVSDKTTHIFLESACFNPIAVRRTSFRHDLRTDAAMRFEKGVDISGVIYGLKRAAELMKTLCGATISSEITDVYPHPAPKKIVTLSFEFLKRLSGKAYQPQKVKLIL